MATTRQLWIDGPVGRLEAVLRTARPLRAAAVLAHPHPLYGGSLHNPVVFHTDRELNRLGLTTLRFNFRGVGQSAGRFDDGRGEVRDLARAVAWLREAAPAVPLVLVGYSFGALCALRHAVSDDGIAAVIAIGLPVRLYPLDEIGELGCPLAVVQGSADEFGTPEEVGARLARAGLDFDLRAVAGASHLFPGDAARAAAIVAAAAGSLLPALDANDGASGAD